MNVPGHTLCTRCFLRPAFMDSTKCEDCIIFNGPCLAAGMSVVFGAVRPPEPFFFEGVWPVGYRTLANMIRGKRIRIQELP